MHDNGLFVGDGMEHPVLRPTCTCKPETPPYLMTPQDKVHEVICKIQMCSGHA